MIGEKIEEVIKNIVHETLNNSKEVDLPNDLIETDNIGEVIEKLSILHCRMWYLEDVIGESTNDEDIAKYKKKIGKEWKIIGGEKLYFSIVDKENKEKILEEIKNL